MPSALYTIYKEDLLGRASGVDLDTDAIQVALVDTGTYTFSGAHQDRADLTGVVDAAADTALASKTITGGVFDAADAVFTAVTGNSIEALVLYKSTGVAATDILIAYIDGFASVTPNGGDITITWDGGANKIFAF